MVKVKENTYLLGDGTIDPSAWLTHLENLYSPGDAQLIQQAVQLATLAGQECATITGQSNLQHGLSVADILVDLKLDPVSIAAAIVYPNVENSELSLEDISEQLHPACAKLIEGVTKMAAIGTLSNKKISTRLQTEKYPQDDHHDGR